MSAVVHLVKPLEQCCVARGLILPLEYQGLLVRPGSQQGGVGPQDTHRGHALSGTPPYWLFLAL